MAEGDLFPTFYAPRQDARIAATEARLDSVESSSELNIRDFASAKPSGVLADGTDDYPAFAAARAQALVTRSAVRVHADAADYLVSQSLPVDVSWVGAGSVNAPRIKALAPFTGPAVFDFAPRVHGLTIRDLKIDCGYIPGVGAFGNSNTGGQSGWGSALGIAENLHIVNVAPAAVTSLTAAFTSGETTITVASTANIPERGSGSFYAADGASYVPISWTGKTATTLTGVTGGSGTIAVGRALEVPVYAIDSAAQTAVGTGTYTGWRFINVRMDSAAHWIRMPVTVGDDVVFAGLRCAMNDATVAPQRTLSTDAVFGASGTTTMQLNSTSSLRSQGRVIVNGTTIVWYTGISGSTLTGCSGPTSTTISAGATIDQYNRPMAQLVDLDGVNMHFGPTTYMLLGITDQPPRNGVSEVIRLGGNDTRFTGTFLETPAAGANFTHAWYGPQPNLSLGIDGVLLNGKLSGSNWVGLVRTQISSAMSSGVRKYLNMRNIKRATGDLLGGAAGVDVFVDATGASGSTRQIVFEFEQLDAVTTVAAWASGSSTSSTADVAVVSGIRNGNALRGTAAPSAVGGWTVRGDYFAASGSPEGVVAAATGSTYTVRNTNLGVSAGHASRWLKITGSSTTGWVGDTYGSGAPNFDAPIGSKYMDVATGTASRKTSAGAGGWTTP